MVQRDHPSPSFGESDPSTLRPSGAGNTVDPENLGVDVREGRMGENDTAGREGPDAQPVGRVVSNEDEVMDDRGMASGVRTPHDSAQDPAKGGESLMDNSGEARSRESLLRPPEEDEDDEFKEEGKDDVDDNEKTRTQQPRQYTEQVEPARPFQPESLYRNDLFRQHSPSTIAANNFENVFEDRIKSVTDSGQAEKDRNSNTLARKMLSGQLIRFESHAEKAAVEEEAKRIAQRRAESIAKQKKLTQDDVKPTAKNYRFQPVPAGVQKTMVNKLVAGKHDMKKLLQGEQYYKQPVLNDVARMALMNGSYLKQDRNRLLKKVQNLLPATRTSQQQTGGAQRIKTSQ